LRGRRIGTVVAGLTLDEAFAARLADAVQPPRGDRFLIRAGPVARAPHGLEVRQTRFRAVAAPLASHVSLLVTAPQSRIDRAADAPRRRILLAGLVTIGCLGLLVYLFAPLIARNRHARQERDRAARVLSHLGEGVFLVD